MRTSGAFLGLLSRRRSTLLLLLFAVLLADSPPSIAQRATGSLGVRVRDANTDEPIFQADVRLYAQGHADIFLREFTDGTGRVTFFSVARDAYTLEVKKEGYLLYREAVDVPPGAGLEIMALLTRERGRDTNVAPAGTIDVAAAAIPAAARGEYEKGRKLLKADPAGSVAHFQKAVERYPKYAEAYSMLGLAHLQLNQNEEAARALQQAIALDAKQRLAHTLLGQVLIGKKQYGEAEKELLASAALDAGAWDTNFQLARCYAMQGELGKALEHARRAQAANQAPAKTYLLLVDIYQELGQPREALEALEAYVKAEPGSPLMPRVEELRKKLRQAVAESPSPR